MYIIAPFYIVVNLLVNVFVRKAICCLGRIAFLNLNYEFLWFWQKYSILNGNFAFLSDEYDQFVNFVKKLHFGLEFLRVLLYNI